MKTDLNNEKRLADIKLLTTLQLWAVKISLVHKAMLLNRRVRFAVNLCSFE